MFKIDFIGNKEIDVSALINEKYKDGKNKDGLGFNNLEAEMTTEETTIFKLKSGDKFTVPSLQDGDKNVVFTFHHLDGMYSYCTFNDDEVAHFKFNTPVEIVR